MAKLKLETRKKARQKRSKVTIDAIVQAAAYMIDEPQKRTLSTNAIAQKAGVSIGSLYQYFPSQEAILMFIINQELEKRLETLKKEFAKIPNDLEIDAFFDLVFDWVLNQFEKKKKIREQVFSKIPRGKLPKIHEIEDQFQKLVFEKLCVLQPKVLPQTQSIRATLVVHSVVGVIHATLAPHRGIELKELEPELRRMVKAYLT